VLETGCSRENLGFSQPSNEKENKIRIPHMMEIRAGPVTRVLDIGVLILAHWRLISDCFASPARRKTAKSSPGLTRLSSGSSRGVHDTSLVRQALSLQPLDKAAQSKR
jgi:hypothetical protein